MASTSTTYQVQVQALWDNTDLKKNAELAEAAVESLAAEFGTTTDKVKADLQQLDSAVSSSLGSTGHLATAADEGATTVKDKLKYAGSEAASEFTQNFGEAIKSGDPMAAVTDTVTALGPALGLAGLGLAAGFGLVKGIIDGAKSKQADFNAAVSGIFTAVEVSAGDSFKKIRKDLFDTLSLSGKLAELGKGDAEAGANKLRELAQDAGIRASDALKLLTQGVNPQTRETYNILKDQVQAHTDIKDTLRGERVVSDEVADAARDLIDLAESQNKKFKAAVDTQVLIRDAMQDQSDWASRTADSLERSAAAAERQRDAINNTRWGATDSQVRGD